MAETISNIPTTAQIEATRSQQLAKNPKAEVMRLSAKLRGARQVEWEDHEEEFGKKYQQKTKTTTLILDELYPAYFEKLDQLEKAFDKGELNPEETQKALMRLDAEFDAILGNAFGGSVEELELKTKVFIGIAAIGLAYAGGATFLGSATYAALSPVAQSAVFGAGFSMTVGEVTRTLTNSEQSLVNSLTEGLQTGNWNNLAGSLQALSIEGTTGALTGAAFTKLLPPCQAFLAGLKSPATGLPLLSASAVIALSHVLANVSVGVGASGLESAVKCIQINCDSSLSKEEKQKKIGEVGYEFLMAVATSAVMGGVFGAFASRSKSLKIQIDQSRMAEVIDQHKMRPLHKFARTAQLAFHPDQIPQINFPKGQEARGKELIEELQQMLSRISTGSRNADLTAGEAISFISKLDELEKLLPKNHDLVRVVQSTREAFNLALMTKAEISDAVVETLDNAQQTSKSSPLALPQAPPVTQPNTPAPAAPQTAPSAKTPAAPPQSTLPTAEKTLVSPWNAPKTTTGDNNIVSFASKAPAQSKAQMEQTTSKPIPLNLPVVKNTSESLGQILSLLRYSEELPTEIAQTGIRTVLRQGNLINETNKEAVEKWLSSIQDGEPSSKLRELKRILKIDSAIQPDQRQSLATDTILSERLPAINTPQGTFASTTGGGQPTSWEISNTLSLRDDEVEVAGLTITKMLANPQNEPYKVALGNKYITVTVSVANKARPEGASAEFTLDGKRYEISFIQDKIRLKELGVSSQPTNQAAVSSPAEATPPTTATGQSKVSQIQNQPSATAATSLNKTAIASSTITPAQNPAIPIFLQSIKYNFQTSTFGNSPVSGSTHIEKLQNAPVVTIGDLHANAKKLLDALVTSNLVAMPEADAQQLITLFAELDTIPYEGYLYPADNLEKVKNIYKSIQNLISNIEWVGGDRQFVLGGDEVADRGHFDQVVMDIIEHVNEGKPNSRIITLASNHSFVGKDGAAIAHIGGAGSSQARSFQIAENKTELQEQYKNHVANQKLMIYNSETKTLYTHAMITPTNIKQLVQKMEEFGYLPAGVTKYEDIDENNLASFIDKANEFYHDYILEIGNFAGKDVSSVDGIFQESGQGRVGGLVWQDSRYDNINQLPFHNKGVSRLVHGHGDYSKNSPYSAEKRNPDFAIVNLNQQIGKGSNTGVGENNPLFVENTLIKLSDSNAPTPQQTASPTNKAPASKIQTSPDGTEYINYSIKGKNLEVRRLPSAENGKLVFEIYDGSTGGMIDVKVTPDTFKIESVETISGNIDVLGKTESLQKVIIQVFLGSNQEELKALPETQSPIGQPSASPAQSQVSQASSPIHTWNKQLEEPETSLLESHGIQINDVTEVTTHNTLVVMNETERADKLANLGLNSNQIISIGLLIKNNGNMNPDISWVFTNSGKAYHINNSELYELTSEGRIESLPVSASNPQTVAIPPRTTSELIPDFSDDTLTFYLDRPLVSKMNRFLDFIGFEGPPEIVVYESRRAANGKREWWRDMGNDKGWEIANPSQKEIDRMISWNYLPDKIKADADTAELLIRTGIDPNQIEVKTTASTVKSMELNKVGDTRPTILEDVSLQQTGQHEYTATVGNHTEIFNFTPNPQFAANTELTQKLHNDGHEYTVTINTEKQEVKIIKSEAPPQTPPQTPEQNQTTNRILNLSLKQKIGVGAGVLGAGIYALYKLATENHNAAKELAKLSDEQLMNLITTLSMPSTNKDRIKNLTIDGQSADPTQTPVPAIIPISKGKYFNGQMSFLIDDSIKVEVQNKTFDFKSKTGDKLTPEQVSRAFEVLNKPSAYKDSISGADPSDIPVPALIPVSKGKYFNGNASYEIDLGGAIAAVSIENKTFNIQFKEMN